MDYTTLGNTGLEISRICLGCFSFGSKNQTDWVLEDEESRAILERAIDEGINFFDTANTYSNGESERILGDVLSDYDRDRMVVGTKSHPERTPNSYPQNGGRGLSRKAIDQDLCGSLARLGMDTVDLYQIHRWDYETAIEETLKALDDAVQRRKARYIGASSMWAYQLATALHTSDQLGLERFVSMQNHYNAVYREEEREMLPLAAKENVGIIPWSPLAGGYLTRPHDELATTTRGERMEQSNWLSERVRKYHSNGGAKINERMEELAIEKGVSMAQISLAWILHQDAVDAPIVGITSVEHLEDAIEALEIDLTTSELEYIEEPYTPVEIEGHV